MERPWFLLPGVPGILSGLLMFLVCWAIAYLRTPKGAFNFEPRGPGSFDQRLKDYGSVIQVIISLATGSIVLLAGTSFFRGGGRLPWFYGSPLVLLAMS